MSTTYELLEPQPPDDTGGLLRCDDGISWMDYAVYVINPTALHLRNEWECPPHLRTPGVSVARVEGKWVWMPARAEEAVK